MAAVSSFTTPEDASSSTLLTSTTMSSSLNATTDGGYDYELLGTETDSRYECPICLLYLRDPVLTTCGHRFCERCISKWVIKEGGKCPVDGVTLEYQNIFPDNFTRREIMQCKAKCPHSKEGCNVVLSLSDLEKHVLSHSNGPEESRRSCSESTSKSSIMLECTYKEVGCIRYFSQEKLQRHLEMDVHHHLQLLTAAYQRLKIFSSRPSDIFMRQDSRDSTRMLLADDSLDTDDYEFRRQSSWDSVRFARKHYIRPRYHGKLAESDESLPSKGSSVSTHTMESESPSQMKDIYERLVRLEQSDREKQIKLERLEAKLTSAVDLFSTVTRVMDDLTARYCHGVYVWKIKDFRNLCTDMRKNPTKVLNSPGFYTGTFEYKLCLRFNVSMLGSRGAVGGDLPPLERDEESFASLYIHFMKGEFDETLSWPFNGEIKLMIIHPTSPLHSLSETMTSKPNAAAFAKPNTLCNATGFGYPEFCPLNKIFTGGFIGPDDTLVCKIGIKAN